MSLLNLLTSKALHISSYALSRKGKKVFQKASKQVEKTQLKILSNLLDNIDGSQSAKQLGIDKQADLFLFQEKVPVSSYENWRHLIECQQAGEERVLSNYPCERYQPTSGSTSNIKWIPYNAPFLDELDHAIGPWMSGLYENFPEIKQGKHYWSLSWVPSDLRNIMTCSINDDLQLLPWWKRLFMAGTMAVPESISLAHTSEESSFATACYLVSCEDLSFISVWSPTFALSLLRLIKEQKTLISNVLATGDWPSIYKGLGHLKAPKNLKVSGFLTQWNGVIDAELTRTIWPNLGLISAWDTSSSKIWADKLIDIFTHCQFQGKGLWATEGVVSIPYHGKYPLAITSHFYEFEDLDTGKIHTSWQLKIGQNVRPIISTANGLLRYAMNDQLKVTDFINACPCLEFIGRLNGIDMVGEKLSPEIAVNIINEFSISGEVSPISLLAIPSGQDASLPQYALLCHDNCLEVGNNSKLQLKLSQRLEERLCQSFHYQLARELGQLGEAKVVLASDAMEIYTEHKISRGMVAGNIKIEPLVLWENQTGVWRDLIMTNRDSENSFKHRQEVEVV
jgi:hypothetical protein